MAATRVDALRDAQFQVEAVVLEKLVTYARQSMKATSVALIGHSYGAYLSGAVANHTAVDAVVLTGFSGFFDYFAPFVAGTSLRVAKLKNPARWGTLDSGYLTSSDIYAETYGYFAAGYFDRAVAEWSYRDQAEPFAVGELPTVLASMNNLNNITAPVLILQGQFDVSACGGNCVGVVNKTHEVFQSASVLEVVDDFPAGCVVILLINEQRLTTQQTQSKSSQMRSASIQQDHQFSWYIPRELRRFFEWEN